MNLLGCPEADLREARGSLRATLTCGSNSPFLVHLEMAHRILNIQSNIERSIIVAQNAAKVMRGIKRHRTLFFVMLHGSQFSLC